MPFIETERGIRIFYKYLPKRGKPVLVFVHGFAEDHAYWKEYASAFKNKLGILLIGLRGHGSSSSPDGKNKYAIARFVDDLAFVVNKLGIKEFYLIGHSLGGIIISEYISQYKPRIKGAVLMATPVSRYDIKPLFLAGLVAAALLPSWLCRMVYGKYAHGKAARLAKHGISSNAVRITLGVLHNLTLKKKLKKINGKVMVVLAAHDEAIKNRMAGLYGKSILMDDTHQLLKSKARIIKQIEKFISC
ncbi:MAG: alpha/beta hydrolase [Nanoarchaeota archaeon]|nr:alpha/beta hydrolase [Nanoarchaeota archaeon]